ncbi:filamentous hemagglutinin N-terminal domain-containing protein [Erwinia amylovora]
MKMKRNTRMQVAKMGSVSFAVLIALGAITPAKAEIVADSSAVASQQPDIVNNTDAATVVNITTPSAAGVSRNTYSQFDVDQNGVILNNSQNGASTYLGGTIEGNSSLADGTASIILNEINSSSASQLNGYIEVAGDKAEVVIANPSGITCDGCGFINASRATLTTGVAQIDDDGNLTGYSVEEGEVTIDGSGMNSLGQDYTDIIARSVKVNAAVRARDLKITTGRNTVDVANEVVTKLTDDETSSSPELALDVTSLGGMYAGKITLVGTESGVGVSNAGTLVAAAGSVSLTAGGDIENAGRISSAGGATLNGANVSNSGLLVSNNTVTMAGTGDVTNSGYVKASNAVLVEAVGAVNNSGSLVSNGGGISLTGSSIDNSGLVYSKSSRKWYNSGGVTLTSTGDLVNSGSVYSSDALTIASDGSVDNSGSVYSSDAVTIASEGSVDNSGYISSGRELTLTSASLTNSGSLSSTGDMALTSDGDVTNTGTIASQQNLTISAATLNSGADSTLSAGNRRRNNSGNLTVTTTGALVAQGTNHASGALSMQGDSIDISGSTTEGTSIDLQATDDNVVSTDATVTTLASTNTSGSQHGSKWFPFFR